MSCLDGSVLLLRAIDAETMKLGTKAFVASCPGGCSESPVKPPGYCAGPGRVAWVLVQSSARYSEKP